MIKQEKVLVTGGTGYIGSHTAVELINSGFDVLIVDDLSNSDISALNGIEKITGVRPEFENFDLCDKSGVRELFNKYKISSVIHFAAFKAVGESVQLPLKYYRNNLVSLLNLLDEANDGKTEALVFSSSCTIYGQPKDLPVTEDAPVIPAESPYGNTKQICEEIIRDTCSVNEKIKAISLRYFNPVGAHETGLIGELPSGVPTNLVPFITQAAAGIRKELRVFGDDYNTPDGSCIRDFIHVVDLAKAHVVALNRILGHNQKSNYEFFNIGTGNGISVLQLIKTFEDVTGVKLNYKIVEKRPGEIEQIWADTTIANRELGWKAEMGVREMMDTAWKWQQNIANKK